MHIKICNKVVKNEGFQIKICNMIVYDNQCFMKIQRLRGLWGVEGAFGGLKEPLGG